jgi:cold shock CspA family protein
MEGKMLWFNPAKGFGFITTDDDERVYVERGGFVGGEEPAGRCGGRRVRFERHEGDGDVRALNVTFSTELEPRRARLRHSRGGRAL